MIFFLIYEETPIQISDLNPTPKEPNIAPKALNDLELVNIENARNFWLLRKQKLIVYMSRPQNSFLTPPQPQNRPTQPQKPKKTLKLMLRRP